ERVYRLCEASTRQTHHSFTGHRQRATSCRTVVHANGRNTDDARTLSRRGASIYRPHPRPRSLLFRQRRIADLFTIGPGPGAWIDRRQAIGSSAGCADHRQSGVPGYVVDSWQGIFAPGKTPPQIVQKANGDIAKTLAVPALIEKLERNAYSVESSSADEFAR